MENKFTGTVPWVAFSQFEYTGDPAGFIKFLKELEGVLHEVPDIYWVNSQNKADTSARLDVANKALLTVIKNVPEAKEVIKKFKEEREDKQ